MLTSVITAIQHCSLWAAGFISRGHTGSGELDEGLGLIALAALLGAFCGLLFGLLTTNIIRYFTFLMGRHMAGHAWTIASVVAGAVLFAVLTATGNKD